MKLPPSHRSSAMTNELAKQRNHFAAERTLTTWIHSCLTLMGFGIAFDRIIKVLLQALPQTNFFAVQQLATSIGLGFIALAICLLLIAIWQYCLAVRFLDRADYTTQPSQVWLTVVSTAIVAFGILSAIAVVVKAL